MRRVRKIGKTKVQRVCLFFRCVLGPRLKISSTWWKLRVLPMTEKVPKCLWSSWNRLSCRQWVNVKCFSVYFSMVFKNIGQKSWSSRCLDADSLLTVVIFSPCPRRPLLVQMSLGGFEITPPVTFRLQSGSGPVHISGQHFVRKFLEQQLVVPLLS